MGEGFPLTVDWIYPALSPADKQTIRRVFLRWIDEDLHAETTTDNHPEPVGVVNDPALVADPVRVRWAVNNYYLAHMRNIGLMALSLDPTDDPDGVLRGYLENATGAWLYTADYALRHDVRGGLAPEGFEYSPQGTGYIAQFLLALQTAGELDPARHGPQIDLAKDRFWDDLIAGYAQSLGPAPAVMPGYEWLGPVYQPAWYGDGQHYWAGDPIELVAPFALRDFNDGDTTRLDALRWLELNVPPGGSDHLVDRARQPSNLLEAIFAFMLFDPGAAISNDPRPSLPLTYSADGLGHILARTSWDPGATWFDFNIGWIGVDHQHADGNQFEFYRHGEWLTKERTGYGDNISSSDYHNTLALENDPPEHNAPGEYRNIAWIRGSQWPNGDAAGDGVMLAKSFGAGFVYALGDATEIYNSSYEGSLDITHASRSIVWLQPDVIVVCDRARSWTPGRFKRFWLQLPNEPKLNGRQATMTTPHGQQLFVTALLPTDARVTAEPVEPLSEDQEPAEQDPIRFRLRVEAPDGPQEVRFLNVLQGADPGVMSAAVTALASTEGTPFAGAVVDRTAMHFPVSLDVAFARLVYVVPIGVERHLITGLTPGAQYDVRSESVDGGTRVTITPGTGRQADAGGLLVIER